MTDPNAFGAAIAARDWYLLAALVLALAVRTWARFSPQLYYRIPRGWRWVPPLALAGAAAFVDGQASGLTLSATGWRVAYAVALAGLALLPTPPHEPRGEAQATPDAVDASKPVAPRPPVLPLLLLALGLCFLLACASNSPRTCAPETRNAIRQLYEAAVSDVIASGACDKVQRVERCAAYMTMEANYVAALRACN